jgi:DHA1 family multidrug resistance protein-like MFS transporter
MRRFALPLPFLAVVLINAGDGVANTLVPLYLDARGHAVEAIGLIVAVYGVTSLLSRLPSGMLYRRRRARRLMYAALALQALSTALYAVPGPLPWFGTVRAFQGFAVGMSTTVNMALFMDLLAPGENRHRHLAGYASALSAGYTVGGLGGGLLGYWLGYGPAFLCAAVFPLCAALCITSPPRRSPSPEAARPVATAGARSTRARLQSIWTGLSHPEVAAVSLVAFFLGVFHFLGQTFVPLYAQNIGLNLAEIGILRSAHSLTNTLARPFCGELTRWVGYRRVAVLGMIALTIALGLTPFQYGLVGLTVVFVLIGLVRAAVLVANTVSVADVQESTVSRGVAVGIYNAARDLGSIVGPILGGYVAAIVGLSAFFLVGPPLVLAVYLLLVWLTSRAAARAPAAREVVR